MKPAVAVANLLCAALLLGCSNSDSSNRTAVQLVLTPDQNTSTTAQVLESIARIEVIVDAEGGLDGVTEVGERPDGGEALDWDDDGELEVRFEAESNGKALPVLEIGLESNAGRELTFRVFGYAADSAASASAAGAQSASKGPAAVGGVLTQVERGQVRRVGTPFNLAPWAKPPRVLMLIPPDGSKLNVTTGTVMLSTTIDPETLEGNVLFIDPNEDAAELEVYHETAAVTDGIFGKHQRSMLILKFGSTPIPGPYRLELGPGITSTAGLRFDQDPSSSAEDKFTSRLISEGPSVGGGPPRPCEECPSGYGCYDKVPGCVLLPDCSAGCPDDYVCDDEQDQCMQDCRVSDQCFVTLKHCNTNSGLCE